MKKSIQTMRRKARLASGLAGKENPDALPSVPVDEGFKVHCGGGKCKKQGEAFKELPVDTKKRTFFEAGLHLISHCLVLKKSLK